MNEIYEKRKLTKDELLLFKILAKSARLMHPHPELDEYVNSVYEIINAFLQDKDLDSIICCDKDKFTPLLKTLPKLLLERSERENIYNAVTTCQNHN